MRIITSKLVLWVSWLAMILAVLATALWFGIIAKGNYCWSAFAFTMMAIPSGGGILLLGVIPGGILYHRKRRRTDLKNLLLAGGALVIILIETILLQIIPMRGE